MLEPLYHKIMLQTKNEHLEAAAAAVKEGSEAPCTQGLAAHSSATMPYGELEVHHAGSLSSMPRLSSMLFPRTKTNLTALLPC